MLRRIMGTVLYLPREYPRRSALWITLVSSILLLLAIRTFIPEWNLLPDTLAQRSSAILLTVFLLAMACEYIDSSLGMGYGTSLTPLLLLMGFEPLQIVPAVLVSELATGLSAGLMHQKDGNVDFRSDRRASRTLLLLSALSALGALAAAWLAVTISKAMLGAFITTIVIAMGIVILASRNRSIDYRSGSIVTVGAVAAFNKGLSGGGYGPLVTAGQVVSGLPAKQAVAITSVAESLTCAVGVLGYLALGKNIDWSLALPLVAGALLSVPLASVTVRRLSENSMRALIGAATLALGICALIKILF